MEGAGGMYSSPAKPLNKTSANCLLRANLRLWVALDSTALSILLYLDTAWSNLLDFTYSKGALCSAVSNIKPICFVGADGRGECDPESQQKNN